MAWLSLYDAPEVTHSQMTALFERTAVGAPPQLVAETRVDFRAVAMDCLERAAEAGIGSIEIDMSNTETVDASGLGTLVVLQKRARERGLSTRLVGTQTQVRALLATTRLEALFVFQ